MAGSTELQGTSDPEGVRSRSHCRGYGSRGDEVGRSVTSSLRSAAINLSAIRWVESWITHKLQRSRS